MPKEVNKYPGLWPTDKNGCDLPTQLDPVTGVPMCRDCWDQNHKRGGVQATRLSLWMLQRQQ